MKKNTKKHRAGVTIYEAKDGWRWRARSSNGKIVAESGEAYKRRYDASYGMTLAGYLLNLHVTGDE